ncbi:hypothetical protein DFJ74DRAFT_695425 [Hyaloraphidium curvatum]|nr:hypothetical protein DFJ74DRAFT_695425 [Hyaloraphidium curvatum]
MLLVLLVAAFLAAASVSATPVPSPFTPCGAVSSACLRGWFGDGFWFFKSPSAEDCVFECATLGPIPFPCDFAQFDGNYCVGFPKGELLATKPNDEAVMMALKGLQCPPDKATDDICHPTPPGDDSYETCFTGRCACGSKGFEFTPNIGSGAECARICDARKGCTHAAYDGTSCSTFTECASGRKERGKIVMAKPASKCPVAVDEEMPCRPAPPQYSEYPGLECACIHADPPYVVIARSKSKCQDLCEAREDCVMATYYGTGDNCFLHSRCAASRGARAFEGAVLLVGPGASLPPNYANETSCSAAKTAEDIASTRDQAPSFAPCGPHSASSCAPLARVTVSSASKCASICEKVGRCTHAGIADTRAIGFECFLFSGCSAADNASSWIDASIALMAMPGAACPAEREVSEAGSPVLLLQGKTQMEDRLDHFRI